MNRMTVREIAAYIGASPFKVYEMVRLKKIPHYRIGNRILFRPESIDSWMDEQELINSSAGSGGSNGQKK